MRYLDPGGSLALLKLFRPFPLLGQNSKYLNKGIAKLSADHEISYARFVSNVSVDRSVAISSNVTKVPPSKQVSESNLKSRNKTLSDTKGKKEKTKRLMGLRLLDLVKFGTLDIEMARVVKAKTVVAYVNMKRVSEKGESRLLPPSSYHKLKSPQVLETVTVLALILESVNHTGKLRKVEEASFRRLSSFLSFQQEQKDYFALKEGNSSTQAGIETERSFIYQALKANGYDMNDLRTWIDCLRAKTFRDAKNIFERSSHTDRWPEFLALFTVRRRILSRLEAHEALRLFQHTLPAIDKNWQFALFIETLRIVHQWHIEFVPTLCQFFLRHSDVSLKTSYYYNQMMWLVSKFGTRWSQDDSLILAESLQLIAADMSKANIPIDTKGYLAIAYITGAGPASDRARTVLDVIKRHEYDYSREELMAQKVWAEMMKTKLNSGKKHSQELEYENNNDEYESNDYNDDYEQSPNKNERKENKNLSASNNSNTAIGLFPYIHGVYAMEILLAQDTYEALQLFDNIPPNDRIAMIWGLLMTKLRELGDMNSEAFEILWNRIRTENVSLTPFLIQRICECLKDTDGAFKILNEVMASSPKAANSLLRSGTVASFLSVRKFEDLNKVRYFLSNFQRRSFEIYDELLAGEAMYDKEKFWDTYTLFRNDGYDPKVSTLTSLCRAAADVTITWGELFAVQRAVVEFKTWVRGAASDGSDKGDVLKLYPTAELFHRYIIMIGRANYDQELVEVLPWMERIQFKPNKICLCALITYSPNGKHLFAHGQKVGGEWPTQYEVDQYAHYSKLK
ncbi:hypothetical protein AWJ20_3166 [Sugiyamaella lignohabitans]|uniref:Mitochondrial group I intron splicing factor CCM1 n=1 Tax=Sugiyamaella lignohabitans TaxID=796027 RepID=A0A167FPF4_9ASCO|nr:uncharacterized protein AWJ20_3166 [Sugiyamaella lignohabitans]ANB15538.1 hypothetical protein AWJ20_3166 [Sugiyamaella lignohabitans]